VVGVRLGHVLQRERLPEDVVHAELYPAVERQFRVPDSVLGPRGEFVDQLVDLLVEFLRRDRVVDEAEFLRFRHRYRVPGHEQFLSLVHVRQQRPDDRPAVARREADVHVRVAELRALDGDDDVTEQRHRSAEASHVPVDAGHERLVEVDHVLDHLLAVADHLPEGVLRLAVQTRPHPVDVAASREDVPVARQHDDAGVGLVGVLEHVGEFLVDVVVHGVELVGVVKRDPEHVVRLAHVQVIVLSHTVPTTPGTIIMCSPVPP